MKQLIAFEVQAERARRDFKPHETVGEEEPIEKKAEKREKVQVGNFVSLRSYELFHFINTNLCKYKSHLDILVFFLTIAFSAVHFGRH